MKRRRLGLPGACLILFCLGWPAPGLNAQQAPSTEKPPEELEAIVITAERERAWAPSISSATRTQAPLKEVPQSILVLPRQLLQEQAAQTLGDALTNASGVVPVKTYQSLILSPLVRGFAAEVFADGMPAYSTVSATDTATLVNVQSVEVIKGPTAALFGGGVGSPLGGIINVISVDPQPASSHTLSLRTGSWQTLHPSADSSLPLNDDGSLALRITGDLESSASHIDVTNQKRWSVNPTLRWQVSPDTTVTLRSQFSELRMLEYSGLPAVLALDPDTDRVSPYRGRRIDPYRFTGAEDAPDSVIQNHRILLSLKHAFTADLELNLTAQYFHNRFEQYSIYTFASAQSPLNSNPGSYPVLSGYMPSRVSQWTFNGWLVSRFEAGPSRHELILGADLDLTSSTAALGYSNFRIDLPDPQPDTVFPTRIGFIDFAAPGSTIHYTRPELLDRTTNRFTTLAAYVQDHIHLFDRLHLLAGLRLISLGIDHEYTTENTFGAATAYDRSYLELAPRLGTVLDLTDGFSAFGAYSEGRRGVLNYTGSDPPVPESSTMIEAGFKMNSESLGLSGSLAAYQLIRQNVPAANPFIPGSIVQVGEQRARGVELDLAWEPSPGFSILFAYAYTDAIVTEDVTNSINTVGQDLDRVGKKLPRVPRHAGRLAARHRFQDGRLKGFGIGLGVTAGSRRPVSLSNNFYTPAYYVADAQLSYEHDSFKAVLSVSNLTDHFYYEPYPYLGEDVVAPARPLSIGLTVSVTF